MTFERENRYIVIKLKDIEPLTRAALKEVMYEYNVPTRECVVVEVDWPEYEPVWQMIENRVVATQIHRDMVEYNNKLAEQADAAERYAAGEDYFDGFQLMAFAVFREQED